MAEHEIFLAAVEIDDPQRRCAYLDEACGADAVLRKDVEELLAAHDRSAAFLAVPALEQMADKTQDVASATAISRDEEIDLSFLLPSDAPASMGRLLHYEVREVIGRGGFGIVLKAFDARLERIVAIKVMLPALAATSPARKRFLREARATASIRHENVVGVHAVEEQPLPFLVMDYVEGETLQHRIDRTGPLELKEVLHIGRQIARGLAAAHAKGLIHRDIKPANILLEAGVSHVRITDFGLARSADDASMTQSGTITGTPLYMSPEQAQGRDLDHRSDLFSLGSVLYVMCSGRPPFRAATSLAVLKRVVEDQPRPIQNIIPEVPDWLTAIIGKLHAKEPAARFTSAAEVGELLSRCLDQWSRHGQVELPLGLSRAISETVACTTVSTTRKDAPATASGRKGRKWLVAVALIAVFAAVGMTETTGVTNVGTTVVRYFSPEGTLVIQIDDPSVSVNIDGGELVITGAGIQELRLKAGQHRVLASRKGEVVQRETVTVTRHGRPVVHIQREAEPQPPSTDTQDWQVDRQAAEYILSLGGSIRIDDQARDIASQDGLPSIPFRLTFINLNGNKHTTAASFQALRNTRNLKGLKLDRASNVTDDALACFRQNKQLAYLGTWGAKVSQAGLEPFRDCDALHSIFLGYSRFGDEDMQFFTTFPALPKMTALLISHCPITDRGLSCLEGAHLMMQLHVDGTRITDAGLQQLSRFPRLEWLKIDNTAITDLGLAHLESCRQLRMADLSKTGVTATGVANLHKALPACRIVWDGGIVEPAK